MKTEPRWMLMAVLLLAGSLGAYAQGGPFGPNPDGPPGMRQGAGPGQQPPGPPEMRGGRPDMLPNPERLRKAGASDEQMASLETLMFEQRTASIDQRATAEKAEIALERLMRTSAPDEKAVMTAIDALNEARGELFKTEIATQLKVRALFGEDLLRKAREQGPPGRQNRPPVPPCSTDEKE